LNNEGPNGELGSAMGDADEGVRLAALHGSIRINVFTGVDDVIARIDDSSALVRRRAAEALGVMRAEDAVLALTLLTSPDTESDACVRAAAVAALGQIADADGKAAVRAAQDDPDRFVRDAARVSLRLF
jgi:HEAT repeat protein